MKNTWCLLGGAGVFAVHTAKLLLARGDSVICVGRNPPKPSCYSLDVGGENYRYEQIHIVFEQDRLRQLLESTKPDYVVNFAALAYATSWESSHRYYQTNLIALSELCEWLLDKPWLKKFVQIGTSELYGSCDKPADENTPLRPTSPYAVSKMAADLHLNTLSKVKGFPMNILRPSNAYGEGQQVWRVIPRACLCALTGERFPLEGGGLVEKSYIHASDLAKAITTVAEKGELGETYNCGPAGAVQIRYLIKMIADISGVKFDKLVTETPGRTGEDQKYWLNSNKIHALGWYPNVLFEQGLWWVFQWVERNKDQLVKEQTSFVLRA